MKVFLSLDGDNNIIGWSSLGENESDVGLYMPEDHKLFISPYGTYRYVDGEILLNEDLILNKAKAEKNEDLNQACRNEILSGFDYMVNGMSYHFSFDVEAQLNFQGANALFNEDNITTVPWTVINNTTNEYERIEIDQTLFNGLVIAIFQHKNKNIIRYRDVLLPKAMAATTVEEVEAIVWDMEV